MSMLGAAQKSPEAFRTISEVAAELDVPQHVLRFWETKFTTIKPLKRGGGRRYYRPAFARCSIATVSPSRACRKSCANRGRAM
jgi:transposase-like protein